MELRPELQVELVEARQRFVEGSFESGRNFMLAFQTAIAEVLRSQSVWAFLRAAMRMKYDIDIGPPRAPWPYPFPPRNQLHPR